MPEKKIIGFLTEKPYQDATADVEFLGRFEKNIGPAFYDLSEDIDAGGHDEYLLKGGRGSLKSSFIAEEIVKILRRSPRGHALVLRKVAATMRDTVYAQMLWALDILGVYEDWDCTVSPMKILNK